MHRLRLVAAALCFIAVGQSCITEEKRGGGNTPRNGREAVGGVGVVVTGVRGHADSFSLGSTVSALSAPPVTCWTWNCRGHGITPCFTHSAMDGCFMSSALARATCEPKYAMASCGVMG